MTTSASPAGAERMQQWENWLALHQEPAIDPDTPIIDPHHHLWDRGGHTYLPTQYLADSCAGHQVSATVYVECLANYREHGPEPLRCVGETAFVAGLSQASAAGDGAHLCAGIVARADLAMGTGVEEVLDAHALAAQGRLRGIRYTTAWDTSPHIHAAYPTHPGMLREAAVHSGARCLVQRGLSLDAWLYFHQIDDVAALARACPDLVIVLDHCGGPIGIGPYAGARDDVFRQWRLALQALRALHNVVLKFGGLAMPLAGFGWRKLPQPPTSAMLADAWRPYFETCLEVFGVQRCMFESNFPVDRSGCSFTVLWNAFKRLTAPLSGDERAALCAGTARRIYRL